MSDHTFTIIMAVVIGTIIVLIVAIIAILKYNWSVDNSKGDFDGEELPPLMWKVTNEFDRIQLTEKQFKQIYGMSTNAYVRKHYGSWKNVDPLDRLVAGNISQEEFDKLVEDGDFHYRSGKHTMIPRKKGKNRKGGGYTEI